MSREIESDDRIDLLKFALTFSMAIGLYVHFAL